MSAYQFCYEHWSFCTLKLKTEPEHIENFGIVHAEGHLNLVVAVQKKSSGDHEQLHGNLASSCQNLNLDKNVEQMERRTGEQEK